MIVSPNVWLMVALLRYQSYTPTAPFELPKSKTKFLNGQIVVGTKDLRSRYSILAFGRYVQCIKTHPLAGNIYCVLIQVFAVLEAQLSGDDSLDALFLGGRYSASRYLLTVIRAYVFFSPMASQSISSKFTLYYCASTVHKKLDRPSESAILERLQHLHIHVMVLIFNV